MESTLKEKNPAKSAIIRPRWLIGVAFAAFILIGLNDGGIGVLLPSLQVFYKVDKAIVSLLFMAGTCGYLISAFSSGPLVAKLGLPRFLRLAGAAFVIGTFLVSLKPVFPIALLGYAIIGFGIGLIDAGLNSYIAALPRSTALLNYLHAFFGTGALLGPLVGSTILAINWEWNIVYLIWAGLGLTVLLAFGLVFNQATIPAAPVATGPEVGGSVLAATLKLPMVWLAAVFLAAYTGAEVSLGSWGYTFLTEQRQEAALVAGWAVSGYWLGLTLGRLTLGWVGEKIGQKRLIQACLVGVVVGVALIWAVPIGGVSAFGLLVAGFSLGPIFPTTIGLISTIVPERLQPSAIGFAASMGGVGVALFPWLAGILAESIGIWTLLPFVMALTAIMLIIWLSLQSAKPQK